MCRRPHILHIFNRYQKFGGEEACFNAFTETLSPIAQVTPFVYSTDELFQSNHGAFTKLRYMLHNTEVEQRLKKCLSENRFDAWIIHNTFPAMSPCVYELAMQQDAPIIHYMHNYRPACLNGLFYRNETPCYLCKNGSFLHGIIHSCWRGNPIFSTLAAVTLSKTRKMGAWKKLSAYVAVSNRQGQLLIESGIPENKIRTIPHFIKTSNFSVPESARKNILFTGRLSPEKGVMQLVQAWKKINPKDRTLYIMGEGPLRQKLERFIAANELSSVKLTGFIPHHEQKNIWDTCGLTVIPSLCEETFGMVALESWQHGAPVIVTPMGGLPELITEEETGWVTGNTSLNALIETLQLALKHENRWQDMGRNGCRQSEKNYSAETWLNAIQKLFKDLSII